MKLPVVQWASKNLADFNDTRSCQINSRQLHKAVKAAAVSTDICHVYHKSSMSIMMQLGVMIIKE